MDWNLTAIIAMISGTVVAYVGKIWQLVFWTVKVPLDTMYMLTTYNDNNNGTTIKFKEDRVDHLNPSQDSGMLINSAWMMSYNIEAESKDSKFSFFGGSNDKNLSYSVSCLRIFREKILSIIDKSMNEKTKERINKIYIQGISSTYFVGEINETHLHIPKVIEDRLNGDRTTRLNILLHGIIGTGKTTMARAIAHKMDMPIYILAISGHWDITDFVRALQRIPDDSVILFDDIDLTLSQIMKTENANASIAIRMGSAAIMAFLDGIYMKQKRWIVIMCTNRPDLVREGLRLRPGRVHIDYECTQQHGDDYIEAKEKEQC